MEGMTSLRPAHCVLSAACLLFASLAAPEVSAVEHVLANVDGRQVKLAGHFVAFARFFHAGTLKRDERKLFGVEVIGAAQVIISFLKAGVHAGGFDFEVERRFGGIVFIESE